MKRYIVSSTKDKQAVREYIRSLEPLESKIEADIKQKLFDPYF